MQEIVDTVFGQETQPRLSAPDLRRDHARVRQLLGRFAHLQSAAARSELMRVALELFEVHCALEDQLYATEATHDAYVAVSRLMQRVQNMDPASHLYMARGLELKDALEAYMSAEEGAEPLLVRHELHLAPYNRNLLFQRYALVAEAQRMLRVH